MILHLTRHGQVLPSGSADPDYPPGDPPLTDLGRRQARLLGERLRDLGFRGPIHTSPYRRTVETAHIVASMVDSPVWLAAPIREVVQREGQMDRFRGATPDELRAEYPRIRAPEDFPYPWWTTTVEDDADLEERMGPLVEQVKAGGEDVLLVGHGATLVGVSNYVLRRHASEQLAHDHTGWNASLSSFRLHPSFELIRFRDVEHLPPQAITSNSKTWEQVQREKAQRQAAGPEAS